MIEATQANFQELTNKGIVVVDFWAPWCGPCRMVTPVLEELDNEMNATFIKVNVDEQGEIAQKYGIMSIPTILVMKDGEVKESLIGFQPKEAFEEKIKKHM